MYIVLFLTCIDFWENTNTGGKMISKRNYNMLTQIYGYNNVYYLGVGNSVGIHKEKNKYTIPFNKKIIQRYYNYCFNRWNYGKREERELIQYVNELDPDIIFFDGTWMGILLSKFQNKSLKAVLTFYHNIESNVYYKGISNSGKFKPWRAIKYWCVKQNEKFLTKSSDFRICMNQRDNKVLNSFFQKQADYFLPTTIIDCYKFSKLFYSEENNRMLLFVGIYFTPTIKGLDWFLKHVLPYLECKLIIVGRGMEQYSSPNITEKVEIVGEVENLSPYYEMADAVVAPIFIGDGMKTKTAEAMMYGKVIFATDEALEGYHVESVQKIYRCNTPNEYIEKITDYFNMNNRLKYNDDVRKYFLENYEYNVKLADFKEWINNNNLLGRV